MKNWKSYQISLFVLGCIALNLLGKYLVSFGSLPLWLDSIGTGFAAYGIGPFGGVLVGGATNIIYGCNTLVDAYYAVINCLIGILIGYFARKGFFESAFLSMTLGMILALVSSIFSMPLNFWLYDGMCGNVWGDAITNFLMEYGLLRIVASFVGEFYIDFLDKVLMVFVVYYVIRIRHRIRENKEQRKLKTEQVVSILLVGLLVANTLLFPGIETKAAKKDSNEIINYSAYIQTVYNSLNGLPGGEANDITQGTNGTLYIGTYSGLYQYDGVSFSLMDQLQSVKNVNCLFSDVEGRLLIGTNDSGLSVCVDNEIIEVMDSDNGLPSNSIRCITENSNGYYYVGTSESMAILELSGGLIVKSIVEEVQYPNQLTTDENGYMAAVDCTGKLFLFHDLDLITSVSPENTEAYYEAASFDSQGNLYVAVSDGTVQKYSILNDKLVLNATISVAPLSYIHGLNYIDNHGIFISADNGAGHISLADEFSYINTNSFDRSIYHMLMDYQGNLWMTSTRLGLLKLCPSNFQELFDEIGIESSVVNAITFWNKRYYIATDDGVIAINEKMDIQVNDGITNELKGVRVRHLSVDAKNHLWVSSYGRGAMEFDTKGNMTEYTVDHGALSNKARLTLHLSNGETLIGQDLGASIIKNGKIVQTLTMDDGLNVSMILCAVETADGTILAGTDGGGIAVIKDHRVVKSLMKEDGLGSEIILRIKKSMYEDGYYIVTSNGICYMDADFQIMTLDDFPYYNNYDVIPAENGELWVTGSDGIYIVSEDELLSGNPYECEHIDVKKGLRQTLTANSRNYVIEDGRLLLCGNTGVAVVNMKNYNRSTGTYHMAVNTMLVDGVVYNVDADSDTSIPRGSTKIEIIPSVVNYSPNDPYISLYLEGFDSEPSIVLQSELTNLVYTNLKSGTYVFHMAVLDNKQERILEEAVYTIVKEWELYDMWYFKVYFFAVTLLLVAYISWMIARTQIQRMIKMQRQEIENLKLKQSVDTAVAADLAKTKFLAQMSHEIRTPINAVLGMNELILRETENSQIKDYAANIENAGHTLLALVNGILDFSKIEGGKLELVPVNYDTKRMIHSAVNSILVRAKDRGLTFTPVIDEELPATLYGDDVRISQIIVNLLTNAVKYTNEGSVTLTVQKKSMENGIVRLYVEVRDTGIGIREEDMKDLFVSFKRLDEKKNRNIEGTGLGMSIVVSLLEMMGSELKVESVYGEGSVFSFEIDQKVIDERTIGVFDVNEKIKKSDSIQDAYPYAPEAKVLVVDDNSMNLKVIEGLLKRNGIKPTLVLRGSEAVECAKQTDYHILFIDHMMPEMDGIETLHMMQENGTLRDSHAVPIVLTANAIVGVKEQYMAEGFADYLSKPIDVASLEQMLMKYLPAELITMKNGESTSETGFIGRLKAKCDTIDTEIGMQYCMNSEEFYQSIVEEFYNTEKRPLLEEHFANKDYDNYRIAVHALKSAALTIGDEALSEAAKKLEFALKDGDYKYFEENHSLLIAQYGELLSKLELVINQ